MRDDFDSSAAPAVTAEQRRIVNAELLKGMHMDNYKERIDLCLQKGGDIDTCGWDKRTPLMLAVVKGDVRRVEYVLSKKPDLFKKDKDGYNVFDIANNINDYIMRQQVIDRLLRALPDGVTVPGHKLSNAVPAAQAEEGEGISLSKPIRLRDKQPPSGGKPNGGFNL